MDNRKKINRIKCIKVDNKKFVHLLNILKKEVEVKKNEYDENFDFNGKDACQVCIELIKQLQKEIGEEKKNGKM